MQQAGAGPDAVVALGLIHFIEALYRNAEAQQLAGMVGQWFAGIEGADAVALLLKRQRIAAGAATGIEDMRGNRKPGEKGRIKAMHVDMQRVVDELLGMAIVIGLGTAHLNTPKIS
jgi:hypothetical protein